MTVKTQTINRKINLAKYTMPFFLVCVAILLFYGNEVKSSVIYGIKLSLFSVLPSIFPFFILSDFLVGFYETDDSILSKIFERFFGITKAAFPAFIVGSFCGFPLGIKCASELYASNKISKSECERLCFIANNPSLAFVISGVGAGMRTSLRDGIILYFIIITSAFIIGFFSKSKSCKIGYSIYKSEQNFDLTKSIKNAVYSSLNVSSYIVFFSTLLGIFFAISKNLLLTTYISPILEIGNATSLLSENRFISPSLSFALTAFSLGFSGLSVYMQTLTFLPGDISKTKILIIKLLQGAICAALALLFYRFINPAGT